MPTTPPAPARDPFGVWYRESVRHRWALMATAATRAAAADLLFDLSDLWRHGGWTVAPVDRPPGPAGHLTRPAGPGGRAATAAGGRGWPIGGHTMWAATPPGRRRWRSRIGRRTPPR